MQLTLFMKSHGPVVVTLSLKYLPVICINRVPLGAALLTTNTSDVLVQQFLQTAAKLIPTTLFLLRILLVPGTLRYIILPTSAYIDPGKFTQFK